VTVTSTASVKFVHCVVCDDVRNEANGKTIVIGAYTAGLTLGRIPDDIFCCLWVSVIWSGEGELPVEFRVLNPSNRLAGGSKATYRSIYRGYESTITLRNLRVHVDSEGTYDIQARSFNQEWESLRRLPILIHPN
jgi:hypothetical protein